MAFNPNVQARPFVDDAQPNFKKISGRVAVRLFVDEGTGCEFSVSHRFAGSVMVSFRHSIHSPYHCRIIPAGIEKDEI